MTDHSVRGARLWGLLLAAVLIAMPAFGDEPRSEIGIVAGFAVQEEALAGPDGDSLEPSFGLRTETMFSEQKLGWFIDALVYESQTDTFRGEAKSLSARTGFDLFLNRPDAPSRWFLSLGGGYWDIGFDNADDYYSFFTSAGIGQRIRLAGRNNLRWELRGDYALASDGLRDINNANGQDLIQGQVLLSYNWGIGGDATPVDSDGDGVNDGRDRCAATPAGATVDSRGCPADTDGDGVLNGIDRCPDSVPGSDIDETGCLRDSDGDGVIDSLDRCPETRRGAPVDESGCMLDGDGDGVDDKRDMCPGTQRGVLVSVSGCPKDSDGDGVYDGLDECPGTPRSVRADYRGCPSDEDGDGVYDSDDECDDTPKGTPVDAQGCPRAAKLFEEEKSVLVLEGVNFESNKATLTGSSAGVLDRVAESLLAWTGVRVEIAGHTDSSGPAEYNEMLSTKRAEAVRDYLIDRGVEAARLRAVGYGEERPVADNGTAQGRRKNRRVELKRLN